MIPHEGYDLSAPGVAVKRVDVQSIEKAFGRGNARLFVPARTNASIYKFGRRRFAEVMAERAEHHRHLPGIRQVVNHLARTINGKPLMNVHRAFGMPLFFLWHADESFQFGKELIECAEPVQPTETD